jgi:hypothetical protein
MEENKNVKKTDWEVVLLVFRLIIGIIKNVWDVLLLDLVRGISIGIVVIYISLHITEYITVGLLEEKEKDWRQIIIFCLVVIGICNLINISKKH